MPGYPFVIYDQYAKKSLNAFNPDILTYTHRVILPDIQPQFISFQLLNYVGYMSEFIIIRHYIFFLFLFDTSLHQVLLEPDTTWIRGNGQNPTAQQPLEKIGGIAAIMPCCKWRNIRRHQNFLLRKMSPNSLNINIYA